MPVRSGLLPTALFLFITHLTSAQQATVKGFVRDADSGESLIGATVVLVSQSRGTTANNYGFYSLSTRPDSVTLNYSFVGYLPQTLRLLLQRDTTININLRSEQVLEEIVVTGERSESIEETSRMSTVSIPVAQIKTLPSFLGEPDVLKAVQLLPGVLSGTEGTTALIARGGSADQNLILMDGTPIYNPSHLYGFFSTFNPDAVNQVELVKGGFPARYGGRLSSILDVSLKEGNVNKFNYQATVGLLAGRFLIEGPISKGRTSFIVSGRRSYLGLAGSTVTKRLGNGLTDGYYFYDLNAKINHRINRNNRIYLAAYTGKDWASKESSYTLETPQSQGQEGSRTEGNSLNRITWGNSVYSLRWNHLFSSRLFMNLGLHYTSFHQDLVNEESSVTTNLSTQVKTPFFIGYQFKTGIRDVGARVDFDYVPNLTHYVRFGVNATSHLYTPGIGAVASSDLLADSQPATIETSATELAAYLEDDIAIGKSLKVNAGLHAATFVVNERSYPSLQPRLSFRQSLTKSLSLKGSITTMQQFVHMLTTVGPGLPVELWVPSTENVKPQSSRQAALGLARLFPENVEVTIEGYYKTMQNLIDYQDGTSYLDSDKSWESKIDVGRGRSYGVELLVQKKAGQLSGWVGYTLSKTERNFENVNDGEWFPFRFDRRHDVKVILNYKLNQQFDLGASWVYATGNAITLPLETYARLSLPVSWIAIARSDVFDAGVYDYPSRNNYRLRDYHRLDFSVNYSFVMKKSEHRLSVAGYNIYNRMNPFYVQFAYDGQQKVLKQVSLFPFMPSINYSIKF